MVKERKPPTRRTQVKDLPKQEKALTRAEQQKVKGGDGGGHVDPDAPKKNRGQF